jgi:hypothetical protein
MAIRIAVADDLVLMRQGLKSRLGREGSQVSRETSDGPEALGHVPSLIQFLRATLLRGEGRLLVGNTCPEGQWTVFTEAFDDDSMGTTSPTHRRSGRAFHRMRVEARGRAHNGKKFKEVCETVVVNAHGGLLMLKHEIDNGEMIVLMNPETLEEQECRVVYLGEPCEKGQRIGVEFLTPAPRFWGLEFGELSTSGGGADATAVH